MKAAEKNTLLFSFLLNRGEGGYVVVSNKRKTFVAKDTYSNYNCWRYVTVAAINNKNLFYVNVYNINITKCTIQEEGDNDGLLNLYLFVSMRCCGIWSW